MHDRGKMNVRGSIIVLYLDLFVTTALAQQSLLLSSEFSESK